MAKKNTVLIVDDMEMNRAMLADMLDSEYKIMEASCGREAVSLIEKYFDEISILLLDIVMPEMDGFEVLTVMNQRGWIDRIPVIVISSETIPFYLNHAYDLGVIDYISRPFNEKTVKCRVHNITMLYAKQNTLEGMVAEQIFEKEKNNFLMVEILSNIVEFRNGESGLHVLHIRVLTEILLYRLMKTSDRYSFTPSQIALIVNASSMHDIGKISIPEEILNKPGKLTKEEFDIMKTHSEQGAQIMKDVFERHPEDLIRLTYNICRWHHERYDGKGYPDGLAGDDIPIEAQVVALADVYDALTSERVYKKAFSHETAIQMILTGECGTFNPILLDCLKQAAPTLVQDLKNHSTDTFNDSNIKKFSDEIIIKGEISDRTLSLLDQERVKYQFFASISNEIQFEYKAASNLLILPELSAEQLGVPTIIEQPLTNATFKKMSLPGSYEKLMAFLETANPQNSTISCHYRIRVKGKIRWYKLVIHYLWADEETQKVSTVFGKLIDIHDEQSKLEKLQKLSEQDSQTSLYNHAAAKKRIMRLLKNKKKQYALLLFDIDDFKLINNTYGHLFGDEVIKQMSQLLQRKMPKDSIAARIGGNEFLLFMEYTDSAEDAIANIFKASHGKYHDIDISNSVGAALAPIHATEYADLFNAADKALCNAKHAGKNQYCIYEDSLSGILSIPKVNF